MPFDPNFSSNSGGENEDPTFASVSAPVAGAGPSISAPSNPLESSDLFLPMRRRQQIGRDETRTSTLSFPRPTTIKTPLLLVLWRLLFWAVTLAGFFGTIALARLLRRSNPLAHARDLRETLERMGPTAIKVGQQLSIRADLLPI